MKLHTHKHTHFNSHSAGLPASACNSSEVSVKTFQDYCGDRQQQTN